MGHLYPENISRHLIHKLYHNLIKFENPEETISSGLLEFPKPLTISEEISYFIEKKRQMDSIIKIVKKRKFISRKKKEKMISILKGLTEENYGVNCADGCYFEEDMYEMAMSECLAIWEENELVEEKNNQYFLRRDSLKKKDLSIKKCIIDYIDL